MAIRWVNPEAAPGGDGTEKRLDGPTRSFNNTVAAVDTWAPDPVGDSETHEIVRWGDPAVADTVRLEFLDAVGGTSETFRLIIRGDVEGEQYLWTTADPFRSVVVGTNNTATHVTYKGFRLIHTNADDASYNFSIFHAGGPSGCRIVMENICCCDNTADTQLVFNNGGRLDIVNCEFYRGSAGGVDDLWNWSEPMTVVYHCNFVEVVGTNINQTRFVSARKNCTAGGPGAGYGGSPNPANVANLASHDTTGTAGLINMPTSESPAAGTSYLDITSAVMDLQINTGVSDLFEAGADLSADPILPVTTDKAGNARTTPYDIGLWEHGGAPPTPEVDPDALTQLQTLGVATFTQTHVFSPGGLSQLQVLGEPTLIQNYVMTAEPLEQSQTLQEAALSVGKTFDPNALNQDQTLGGVTYTQRHFFTPSALQQLQELDNATLQLEGEVSPDAIVQLQTLDVAVVDAGIDIDPDPLEQAQVLDNVVLSIGIPINPDALAQSQMLSATTIEQEPFITAAPLEQAQTLDVATVQITGEIAPANLEQLQSLSSPTMGVEISPVGIEQSQSLDNATTQYEILIPVDNLTQAQLLENAGLFQRHLFIADNLEQAQTLSNAFVFSGELYVHPDRLIFVEDENRFVLVLKEERIIQ